MQNIKKSALRNMLKFINDSIVTTEDGDTLYQKTNEDAVIALDLESFQCVTRYKAEIIKAGILHSKDRINKKISFKVDIDKLRLALNKTTSNKLEL